MENTNNLMELKKRLEMNQHNLFCYSANYAMTRPQKGFDEEWKNAKENIIAIEMMIELTECGVW